MLKGSVARPLRSESKTLAAKEIMPLGDCSKKPAAGIDAVFQQWKCLNLPFSLLHLSFPFTP